MLGKNAVGTWARDDCAPGKLGAAELSPTCWARTAGLATPSFILFIYFLLVKITKPEWNENLNKFLPTRKLCNSRLLSLAAFQTQYSWSTGHKKTGTSV